MERRIVLVSGAGHHGPRTLTGVLEALGLPLAAPDFVGRLHGDLLGRCDVAADDARPAAWLEAGKVAVEDAPRARLEKWLRGQLDATPELVVTDPGLPWLLGLWRWAALRCDASVAPVVVVGDAPRAEDGTEQVAGLVNALLHTELATRGEPRHYVRYADLLADWTVPVAALGETFDLRAVRTATAIDQRRVHDHVTTLRPEPTADWADLRLPGRLCDIAAETAAQVARLADPDGDTPEVRAALDRQRAAYLDLYEEAASITRSSVVAVRNRRRK